MVTDADRSIDWMLQAAADWQRARIAEGAATARRRLGRSLRETALRAAALGAVTLLAAVVLGLPAPLALGVLVFLGGFIPLLGPIATTAFVGLVALGTGGLLAATVAIGALVATTIFLPRILGPDRWRGHGIHPGVVLVALTIGGVVGGPLGMVLGVPVAIVLREVAPSVIAALNGTLRPELHEGIVPRWLDRLAQWSWRLLILAGVTAVAVAALVQVPLIVIPLVLAAVAAATLAPGAAHPAAARPGADHGVAGDDRRGLRRDPRHPRGDADRPSPSRCRRSWPMPSPGPARSTTRSARRRWRRWSRRSGPSSSQAIGRRRGRHRRPHDQHRARRDPDVLPAPRRRPGARGRDARRWPPGARTSSRRRPAARRASSAAT